MKNILGLFDRIFPKLSTVVIVSLLLLATGTLISISAVKRQANDAVAIAVGVSERVDGVEVDLAEVKGKNAAQDRKIAGLDGRVDAVEEEAAQICQVASDAKEMATDATNLANGAKKVADTVATRQNSRVGSENQQYKLKLGYIRGANPDFALCAKTDTEIDRLLNDGKWNVEGQIQTEYDRLVATVATEAKESADVLTEAAIANDKRVDAVSKTVEQALDAGETSVGALNTIANQKTSIIGKSVSRATKKGVAASMTQYYKKYEAK